MKKKRYQIRYEFSDVDLVEMVKRFLAIYREKMNADFPTDQKNNTGAFVPYLTHAKLKSYYRRMNGTHVWSTAKR